jgi:hypothetical protein
VCYYKRVTARNSPHRVSASRDEGDHFE